MLAQHLHILGSAPTVVLDPAAKPTFLYESCSAQKIGFSLMMEPCKAESFGWGKPNDYNVSKNPKV